MSALEGTSGTRIPRTAYICDSLAAAMVVTASRVAIRLVTTPSAGGCVAAVGEHSYVVEGALPSGTYDLTVALDHRAGTPIAIIPLETRIRID